LLRPKPGTTAQTAAKYKVFNCSAPYDLITVLYFFNI